MVGGGCSGHCGGWEWCGLEGLRPLMLTPCWSSMSVKRAAQAVSVVAAARTASSQESQESLVSMGMCIMRAQGDVLSVGVTSPHTHYPQGQPLCLG